MILCNAFTAILLFAQNVLHCIINCYTPYHPLSTYAKFFEDLVFLTRNISRGGGDWGDPPHPRPPHYPKNWLVPPMSPHCFDPKMPILSFSCSFWPFCPNCPPPPVDPIWETLSMVPNFQLRDSGIALLILS